MIHLKRLSIICAMSLLLTACSGGGGAWDPDDDDDDDPALAPSAPVSLAVNAGNEAVNLGWGIPTTNGTGSIDYEVSVSPSASGAEVTVVGTTALVRGLDNDTTYTFSVTASNNSGTSPAASIQATPIAPATDFAEVTVAGNPSGGNGLAEPALLRTSGGQIWMAYTDVNIPGSGVITRSAIRLAQSSDNGATYTFNQEVTEPATALPPLSGQWHYRTPSLIEDSSDPDATRRFKLFAHKYLYGNGSPDFASGALSMWTAATPDGEWSEEIVLGWTATPAVLQPPARVNQLDPALQSCLWIDEGSASVGSDGIDMVFSCANQESLVLQRKIVLLHSADHGESFTYVATLLEPADALAFGGDYFSMPALVPGAGNAPALLVSPIAVDLNIDPDGTAQGCVVFPIADRATGELFMDDTAPLALQTVPAAGVNSGGCSWDRSIPLNGILMGDRDGNDATIQASGKSL